RECDTPACVRPEHLFLGTHQENMADMLNKGRKLQVRGDTHGRAKLTSADISTIRQRAGVGESQKALARSYGVHPETIRHVLTGEGWSHV
ncbi:MAG TPA: hypothetical protein VGK33_14410, partial [Chloroflexota bacterium]